MPVEVRTKASKEEIRWTLMNLPAVLCGRAADPTGLVADLHLAVGLTAMSIIRDAYVVKARGGTDASGLRWAKLSPKTIAYKRKHPGLVRGGRGSRPLLTSSQDKLWRAIFVRCWHKYGDKATAARIAWSKVKAVGGQTIIGKYGNTAVEILRDQDILLNSLSPTTSGPGEGGYVTVLPGSLAIGTNVPYAWFHQYGTRFMPARPIFPAAETWPEEWRQILMDVWTAGVKELVETLVETLKAA